MSGREERGISSLTDVRRYLKYSHLPLALYGAAGTAEKMRDGRLSFASISIDAICDSDSAKHGQMFHGLVILSPEELVRSYPDANILIAVVDKYIPEVHSKLRSLGVRPDRIFKWAQADDISPSSLAEFSVCPWRDLFRIGNRFADAESRELFRRRYRHWLLADRPENPGVNEEILPGMEDVPVYRDAGELCCDIDWRGGELAGGDVFLEFENSDALVPRAIFTIAGARPDGAFFLREGSERSKTRFCSLDKDSVHAV